MSNQSTEVAYKIVPANDVALTITFGDGQLGASTIIGANAIVGEVRNWTVGKGDDLRGKAIDIHSVLTDVNASSNRLSGDYALTGGDHPQTIFLESTVDNDGDSDRFHITINFI
jgi:hypothetical protein